jgi:hypothetical protein
MSNLAWRVITALIALPVVVLEHLGSRRPFSLLGFVILATLSG